MNYSAPIHLSPFRSKEWSPCVIYKCCSWVNNFPGKEQDYVTTFQCQDQVQFTASRVRVQTVRVRILKVLGKSVGG